MAKRHTDAPFVVSLTAGGQKVNLSKLEDIFGLCKREGIVHRRQLEDQ